MTCVWNKITLSAAWLRGLRLWGGVDRVRGVIESSQSLPQGSKYPDAALRYVLKNKKGIRCLEAMTEHQYGVELVITHFYVGLVFIDAFIVKISVFSHPHKTPEIPA